MGGGLLLSVRIKRADIRAEGRRLGLRGMDLEEFEAILVAFDDERVLRSNDRAAVEMKSALAKSGKKPRR